MSQDASARLGLPYLLAGQLQKHVTLNEALTRLDLLVQTVVKSRSEIEPPAHPVEGSLYIVPAASVDPEWEVFAPNDLIRFELGHWLRQDRTEGLMALVLDEGLQVAWLEGDWQVVGAGNLDEIQSLSWLGLNTTADANNPFAARLNKALWTALEAGSGGDGDLRVTFNKEGATDVLSLLFQSNWGGRAELGLIGEDDLSLKVSANGASWHEAFRVDRTSGTVRFAKGATRAETAIITADSIWSVPTWARWLEVGCVAGGGGGGAGLGGAAASPRLGGGGGGAGGMVQACWPVASLGGTLALSVGTGGTGGSGQGQAGGFGGNSQVALGSQTLVKAYGGHGGAAGTASEGLGGQGGIGQSVANAGGNSGYLAHAYAGQTYDCPTGAGGGGGGGGLDASHTPYRGGEGGSGGVVLAISVGGASSAGTGEVGASCQDAALNPVGGGGGGGGGSATGLGHDGGQGGLYGAGGGGGGAGQTGGGSGGAGAAGVIIITAVG